ncbi:hypothetical protein SISSUDRAFT_1132302 [Sistotremastrum suecicum HHB10207 ss-3]|uniref:F-box domain-containing protein n=1 Tax=Sistotremastrum suecicum HHB10207 ss-3 TaxID=1314776 RepID=A0A165Z142_9AGAM|nr:hypothetical protein SISSUDRAFT_1132302 [Sistotremastrum suecicum HHB10207 ss-3]
MDLSDLPSDDLRSERLAEAFNESSIAFKVKLRREHNLEVPFGRLPDDILREISIEHVHIWRMARGWKKCFGWRTILAVSSRLRSVTLETPTLWTTISLDWPTAIIYLFRSRSKGLPLHLQTDRYIGNDEHKAQAAGKFIALNIDVISSLDITWDPPFQVNIKAGSFGAFLSTHIGAQPFPHLRRAKILHEDPDIVSSYALTMKLNAPQLECLHLEAICLNPKSIFQFPRLRTLHIQEVKTNVHIIWPVLAACPLLESCFIDCTAPRTRSQFGDAASPPWISNLVLPSLKTLTINGFEWVDIITFSNFLRLPSDSTAKLSFEMIPSRNLDEDDDLALVLPRLLNPLILHYTELVLIHAWNTSKVKLCSVEGSSLELGFEDILYDSTFFDLPDPLAPSFSFLSEGIAKNLTILDLTNTTSEIPGDTGRAIGTLPCHEMMASALKGLPNLVIFRATRWANTDSLFLAFKLACETDAYQILCPSLRELSLRNSYFIPQMLLEFVQMRKRRGVELEVLTVVGEFLADFDPSLLEDQVTRLIEEPFDTDFFDYGEGGLYCRRGHGSTSS